MPADHAMLLQQPIRRLFIAHAKSLAQPDLDDLVELARSTFPKTLSDGRPFGLQITTGRESAEAWMAAGGKGKPFNWNAWVTYVTGMTSAFGGEPRFHWFLPGPGQVVGRVTADILRRVLGLRRPVFFIERSIDIDTNQAGPATLRKVVAIRASDANNWKAAAYLVLG